jgi:hypothetical protein
MEEHYTGWRIVLAWLVVLTFCCLIWGGIFYGLYMLGRAILGG